MRHSLATACSVILFSAIAPAAPHHSQSPTKKHTVSHRGHVPPETPPGPDFLAKNGAAKGVVTTSSGLEYFTVKSGPVKGRHPTADDTVTFDYEGKLLTGETFDSSYTAGQPLVGKVGDFVPGFTEALELMRPGDEWIVWVPPQLGYGDRDVGPIPANSVLRFKLVLHSVTPAG